MTTTNDPPITLSSIDLRTVPVYILSPNTTHPTYTHRRQVQHAALTTAGFTTIHTIPGIYDPTNPVTACSIGHAYLIETALTTLTPFRPFLILEDDALPEEDIPSWTLQYPSTADAIYPSMASDSADLTANDYIYTFTSTYVSPPPLPIPGDNLTRIYNMLTSHAVLILTLPFALNWLRCATEAATRSCGFDVLVAYTMKEYHVYAQPRPWFYQAEIIGGKEFETRLVLQRIPVSGPEDVPDARMECVSFRIAKLRGGR